MRPGTRFVTLLFAAISLCAWSAVAQTGTELDAPKVDAAHHNILFENEQVRVVHWIIQPGDKTAKHSHPAMVSIFLTSGEGKATTPDGKTSMVHAKAGAVAWRTPGTHIVENVGTQPLEGILVEPKKPASSRPPGSQDVIVADPAHNKVEFENEQVRVIRYHYAPGEKSPMHGHPDNVQVVLTDAKTKITTADGKAETKTAKAGDVNWRTATQHRVENTGDQPFEGILVEMKGGPQAARGK